MRSINRWTICSFLAFASVLQAALPAGTTWELRNTDGSSSNGGCYVAGSTGVDYSQQNAAQYTFTDLVLVTTTTVSSASHAFDANDIGNCLHITAGTNFTVGFYQIVSQAAGVATLDRAAGTMGSTGGTYAVGGALALPTNITNLPALAAGNVIWMKNVGTYTVAAATSSSAGYVRWFGYGSTRGDGVRPTWTSATNSAKLLSLSAGNVVRWINFSHTASTRAICVESGGSSGDLTIADSNFDGCLIGVSFGSTGYNRNLINVEVENSVQYGVGVGTGSAFTTGSYMILNCYIHDNAGLGVFSESNDVRPLSIVQSTIANNAGGGVSLSSTGGNANSKSLIILSSNFYGNSGTAISMADTTSRDTVIINSSVIYGSTTGVSLGATQIQVNTANGLGANSTNYVNFTAGVGDVAFSADPFTNPATNDYSLNSTVGGGAAAKGTGYPGLTLFGTGYLDIGALQGQVGIRTPVNYGITQ